MANGVKFVGPGSFFKSHKDTPRSSSMFGSLVIVYPTAHDGGALTLRNEDGEEWKFDSAKVIRDTEGTGGGCIAYTAFYSDVEHEVSLVTSGYRVSVTYNLYFGQPESSGFTAVASVPSTISGAEPGTQFKMKLQQLLDEPNFLPDGGCLGFGLHHWYPIDHRQGGGISYLKGSDATIKTACTDLGLLASPKLIYWFTSNDVAVMVDEEVTIEYFDEDWEKPVWKEFLKMDSSRVIQTESRPDSPDHFPKLSATVHWVTPLTRYNDDRQGYTKYGNEAEFHVRYQRAALIVEVGPVGNRAEYHYRPPKEDTDEENQDEDSEMDQADSEDEDDSE